MDSNVYELGKSKIKLIMSSLAAPSTRYKGLIVSTKDQQNLAQLVNILQQELKGFDFWLENTDTNTPSPPVSRSLFNQLVFEQSHPGLILVSPEEWMFDWSILDKRSFWSALSETYGGHIVIAVVAETSEFNKIIQNYFVQRNEESIPFNIWSSKYQQRN